MRLEKDDVKIGLLVFLTLALFVGFLLHSGMSSLFRRAARVHVRLENAADVAIGTEVQLQGLRVGQVEQVRLQRDGVEYHFLASLGLRTDIVLWEGTRALVVARPLGGSFLDLQLPPPARRQAVLGPDSVLDGATGPSLATLAENINTLVGNLNQGVDEVRGRLQAGGLGAVLDAPQVRAVFLNLNRTLASFQLLAEDGRRLAREGGGTVRGLDRALASAQQVVDQVQTLLSSRGGDLETIMVRLASTLREMEGLGQELRVLARDAGPEAVESLKSLDRTLRSTENLLELLTAKPNRLVWGKPTQAEQDAAAKRVEEARKAQGAKP